MRTFFILIFLFLSLSQSFSQTLGGNWTSKGSGIAATNHSFISVAALDSVSAWGVSYQTRFSEASRRFTRTTDGGKTWKSGIIDPTGGNFFSLSIFALDTNTAWVIMTNLPSQNQGRIYKTTNGGQSWEQQTGSFNNTGNAITSIHFFNANDGVAFGSAGTGTVIDSLRIWNTSDGGSTWTRIPKSLLPAPLSGEGTWLQYGTGAYEAKGDILWFGTRKGRIWKTTDKGRTWSSSNTGVNITIYSIAFANKNGMLITETGGLKTQDEGQSWTPVTLPSAIYDGYYQIENIPGQPLGFWLAYEGSGGSTRNQIRHAYTLDHGSTWVSMDNPFNVECFSFVSPTIVWGGSRITSPDSGGMIQWIGNFGTVTSIKDHENMLASPLKLNPNPFSASAILEFKLSNHSIPVNIFISDFMGRTLETIHIEEPGSDIHQLEFGDHIPKGMYLLTLQQGPYLLSKPFFKQ